MRHDSPIMIMAGGTGGHIFPGIAVGQALATHGVAVIWLGSARGLENQLVPAAGFMLETIDIGGLRGEKLGTFLVAPLRILRAIWQARALVKKHRPQAALSLGGFAAGPGGIAAWLAGIPLIVHEQNRIPGFTNRVLAKIARRVLTGFPESFKSSSEWIGNPVRKEIAAIAAPEQRFAARSDTLHVLVIGGSQGARVLNIQVPPAVARLGNARIKVRHQCGSKMLEETCDAYAEHKIEATVEAFITDMATAYTWADIVVCRAGALTIAELCAVGLASILVPFPLAVDDHQTLNAQFLVAAGAALLLPESEFNAESLATCLDRLANNVEQRLQMAKSARALAKPKASDRVAEICLEAV